jgi:hypothetical protein
MAELPVLCFDDPLGDARRALVCGAPLGAAWCRRRADSVPIPDSIGSIWMLDNVDK